jgi:hypothetical protein
VANLDTDAEKIPRKLSDGDMTRKLSVELDFRTRSKSTNIDFTGYRKSDDFDLKISEENPLKKS